MWSCHIFDNLLKIIAMKNPIAYLSALPFLLFGLWLGIEGGSNKPDEGEGVDLRWKVPQGDTLFYKTTMSPIEDPEFTMDFDKVFGQMPHDINDEIRVMEGELLEKLKKINTQVNLTTSMTNSAHFEDVVEVTMVGTLKEGADDDFAALLAGTLLRGSIHKDGRIHSFWLKSRQKNLLSIFFELPPAPVKEGGIWELKDLNFISNDHHFVCERATRRNLVKLSEIKVERGDTIAVLDYDLYEYVSGAFHMPNQLFNEEETGPVETTMDFKCKARAEFSVGKGRWLSFQGVMSVDAAGALEAKQRQKFALEPL